MLEAGRIIGRTLGVKRRRLVAARLVTGARLFLFFFFKLFVPNAVTSREYHVPGSLFALLFGLELNPASVEYRGHLHLLTTPRWAVDDPTRGDREINRCFFFLLLRVSSPIFALQ